MWEDGGLDAAMDAVRSDDAGTDSGVPDALDGGAADGGVADGGVADANPEVAERRMCISGFGSALTEGPGVLDGTLVAFVAPSRGADCNRDPSHVHLQVDSGGQIYDVAINVGWPDTPDVRMGIVDGGLSSENAEFSPGWRRGEALDYVAEGLHSSDFLELQGPALVARLEQELATSGAIRIVATAYGRDGMHLVHRSEDQPDGALVVGWPGPLKWIGFRFARQRF